MPPHAEIISIGSEILLGDIVDTNTPHIARALRDLGLELRWTSSVGDDVARIAEAVRIGLSRSNVVITTGGLGPTVDDPTREAIARAFGREVEYREELWEQIKQRFSRWGRAPTENNRRQAHVPAGATAIENPVGTAPAFIVERDDGRICISLPGVPAEMETLLANNVVPYLRRKLMLSGVIKTRVLHVAGLGESQIDEEIGDLEGFANPTVGLAAHHGIVDVRITARANNQFEADEQIWGVEATARQRLGSAIFGADGEPLEAVTLSQVQRRGWRLAVVEAGTGGLLSGRLAGAGTAFAGGQVVGNAEDIAFQVKDYAARLKADVGLGVRVTAGQNGRTDLDLILLSPDGEKRLERGYGGPPARASTWAVNLALNWLRLQLLER